MNRFHLVNPRKPQSRRQLLALLIVLSLLVAAIQVPMLAGRASAGADLVGSQPVSTNASKAGVEASAPALDRSASPTPRGSAAGGSGNGNGNGNGNGGNAGGSGNAS